jgi:hypothetical protein
MSSALDFITNPREKRRVLFTLYLTFAMLAAAMG